MTFEALFQSFSIGQVERELQAAGLMRLGGGYTTTEERYARHAMAEHVLHAASTGCECAACYHARDLDLALIT